MDSETVHNSVGKQERKAYNRKSVLFQVHDCHQAESGHGGVWPLGNFNYLALKPIGLFRQWRHALVGSQTGCVLTDRYQWDKPLTFLW